MFYSSVNSFYFYTNIFILNSTLRPLNIHKGKWFKSSCFKPPCSSNNHISKGMKKISMPWLFHCIPKWKRNL